MYTLEEFLKIRQFLSDYNIPYEDGYIHNGEVCGYWIEIESVEIKTNEVREDITADYES